MRVLLLGHPVDHSLSPGFQNAAFEALGLSHRYELHDLPTFDPEQVRRTLLATTVLGANVTVPHKGAARAVLDVIDPVAERIGAVNTIVRRDTHLLGTNTDAEGFSRDLRSQLGERPILRALVLGAGGAAQAVVAALQDLGCAVSVANRTVARAERLARQLDAGGTVQVVPLSAVSALAHDLDVVVDATSLGLGCRIGERSFEEALQTFTVLGLDGTPSACLFYDLKYDRITPFLRLAASLSRPRSHGLGMLVWQGAIAFELWTGQSAPIDVMRAAVGL